MERKKNIQEVLEEKASRLIAGEVVELKNKMKVRACLSDTIHCCSPDCDFSFQPCWGELRDLCIECDVQSHKTYHLKKV